MKTKDLELSFSREVGQLVEIGKLRRDDIEDFGNVRDHCLAVGIATEVMRRSLDLSRSITSAAILHDLKKRYEKRPQDFDREEEKALNEIWMSIPSDLRNATTPLTREVAMANNTLRSRVLNLADMWTLGSDVVGLRERMDGTRARWPHLDWDFHMEWGGVLETMIWDELKKQGLVSGEQRLLAWVQRQIEK